MNSIPGGAWPTRNQELLLKAALFKGEDCRSAWEQWKRQNDVEHLDNGSHRLLPLAYHNLCSQGIQDGLLVRLKSVYRYMLAKNHLMFHGLIPVLKALEARGIKTMLLKGAALTLTHYTNYGLRPQLDIDVLIPETCAHEAIAYFRTHGWRPEYDYPVEKVTQFRHSCGFEADIHKRIDLHWNIFQECREKGTDAVFWENAIPVKVNDVDTYVLSPAHQLLHTCIHGVKWNTMMPCRWVADAVTILNISRDDINWNDLVALARERDLTIPIWQAFTYLRHTFAAEIPEFVLSHLAKTPTSLFERVEYRVMIARKSLLFGNFFKFTFSYAHVPHSKNLFVRICDYFYFLQMYWKIRNMALMPFLLIRDGIRSVSAKRKQPGGR
jgi:hypothetical protein